MKGLSKYMSKKKLKIATIVGARPQFIKVALLSNMLRKHHNEVLIHTGQHYNQEMSDVFFNELSIPIPEYNLEIGSNSQGAQTGRMIESIETVLVNENPDLVIIFGDTNSTLAGAIAASKLHIPIVHVEAGLRSYNKRMPEEVNRVLSDHVSDLLLCPTNTSVRNLENEGISKNVYNVGDIMYDVILSNIKKAEGTYSFNVIAKMLGYSSEKIPIECPKYYLSTIHRAENTENVELLLKTLDVFESLDYPVIFPLHPRTQKLITNYQYRYHNIYFLNPVGYLLMIYLIKNAKMVITDSGGVQKEAYFLRTPCTTLRNETEWVETLLNGWNVLCSQDDKHIYQYISRTKPSEFPSTNPFGDGKTTEKIIELINYLYSTETGEY